MISDADEYVTEPFAGIDVVGFAGGEEAIHHRSSLCSLIGPSKELVLATQGQRADFVLDLIIIDLNATVV